MRDRAASCLALCVALGCGRGAAPPAPSEAPPAPSEAPADAIEAPEVEAADVAEAPEAEGDVGLDRLASAPEGFADLRAIPNLRVSIGYHSPENFTGTPLPGYGAPGAWLTGDAAASLGRVQSALEADGLGLLVFDAYRPARASRAMVAWAERSGRMDLIRDGYVAPQSGHNRGDTIDLTLCALETGAPLDMGTAWDVFTSDAHTANAAGEAAENRARLVAAMGAEGWSNYAKEWWHFSRPGSPRSSARDVPYGCFEAPEGAWAPPEGWTEPGWASPGWPPADAPDGACR